MCGILGWTEHRRSVQPSTRIQCTDSSLFSDRREVAEAFHDDSAKPHCPVRFSVKIRGLGAMLADRDKARVHVEREGQVSRPAASWTSYDCGDGCAEPG